MPRVVGSNAAGLWRARQRRGARRPCFGQQKGWRGRWGGAGTPLPPQCGSHRPGHSSSREPQSRRRDKGCRAPPRSRRAGVTHVAQRQGGGSGGAARWLKAARTFGPQVPPATAAWCVEKSGSMDGPTAPGSRAPNNRRKQLGSWSGRRPAGVSAPRALTIQTRRSTDGPRTRSRIGESAAAAWRACARRCATRLEA